MDITGDGLGRVPQGPGSALRQGLRIFRQAPWLLMGELMLIGLVAAIFFYQLFILHVFQPLRSTTGHIIGLMPPTDLPGSIVVFALGVVITVLEIGWLRSISNVMDGRPAQRADLLWGIRRGEVWLLAIVMQVVQIVAGALAAGGARLAGAPNPAQLTFATPAHVAAPLFSAVMVVILLIVANTSLLAAAAAARFELPAMASFVVALRSFRYGRRRYLGLAVLFMLMMAVLILAGTTVLLLLTQAAHAWALPMVMGAILEFVTAAVWLLAVMAGTTIGIAAFVVAIGALKHP
ncbi:MAG: hypothetical protein ACYCXG_00915 [Acidiferrobacter sp.]